MRAWPQLEAGHLDAPFTALGTDDFDRSDTRVALRGFFEVDRHNIALLELATLRAPGRVDAPTCVAAIERYGLDAGQPASWA